MKVFIPFIIGILNDRKEFFQNLFQDMVKNKLAYHGHYQNFPLDGNHLLRRGKYLEDDLTLARCGIEHMSTVNIIVSGPFGGVRVFDSYIGHTVLSLLLQFSCKYLRFAS